MTDPSPQTQSDILNCCEDLTYDPGRTVLQARRQAGVESQVDSKVSRKLSNRSVIIRFQILTGHGNSDRINRNPSDSVPVRSCSLLSK